jgi:hypothetical protein
MLKCLKEMLTRPKWKLVRVGVQDFLTKAFEKFYIIIWSYMKLEDVVEVLPMLVLEIFVDQFVFI